MIGFIELFVSPHGRIDRKRYAAAFIGLYGVLPLAVIADIWFVHWGALFMVHLPFVSWCLICIKVKRMRDCGGNPWGILLPFVWLGLFFTAGKADAGN